MTCPYCSGELVHFESGIEVCPCGKSAIVTETTMMTAELYQKLMKRMAPLPEMSFAATADHASSIREQYVAGKKASVRELERMWRLGE